MHIRDMYRKVRELVKSLLLVLSVGTSRLDHGVYAAREGSEPFPYYIKRNLPPLTTIGSHYSCFDFGRGSFESFRAIYAQACSSGLKSGEMPGHG